MGYVSGLVYTITNLKQENLLWPRLTRTALALTCLLQNPLGHVIVCLSIKWTVLKFYFYVFHLLTLPL